MRATAVAPANIAFIKYWAKVNPELRIPRNNSISMNLSDLYTTTTIEFDKKYHEDSVQFLDEQTVTVKERIRMLQAFDQVRNYVGSPLHAKVVTKNNFPKATGIASSASGFAALTVAALSALDYQINNTDELSRIARRFSGTACRSIPDGFVEWEKGHDDQSSYAKQLFPPDWWDIRDVVAIVTETMKEVGSTEGHALADTSLLYEARIASIDPKVRAIKDAMKRRDFPAFGRILEEDSFNMHAIALTSSTPLVYWEPQTIAIIKKVFTIRASGKAVGYVTIDAGPTVHIICERQDADFMKQELEKISGVLRVVVNKPAQGAHLVDEHLF